jgi:RecT family
MNQVATRENSINSVSVTAGANGSSIAPQNLGEVVRFAEVMSKADIALPKHLRGNAGACMAVAMQALEWQMSPFAVASKSYSVNGTIAYEAQLIAAVVNTRSGIKGRLKYAYNGTGNDMTCTVSGILDGEVYEYTSPSIGSITTKNSPLWKSDPQQQLGYFAARSWARRYVPEVLLGVYDREEAQEFQGADNAKNITPVQTVADPFGEEPQSAKIEEAEIIAEEPETPASEPGAGEQGVSGDVATPSNEKRDLMKLIIQLVAYTKDFDANDKKSATDALWDYVEGFKKSSAVSSPEGIEIAKKITRMFVGVVQEYNTQASALEDACKLIGTDPAQLDEVE